MILRILPNRQMALLLSMREASMLESQILDPGDYPWQDSESQAVAMAIRMLLRDAVDNPMAQELDKSIDAILRVEALRREALGEGERSPEDDPAEVGVKPQSQEE